MNTAHESESTFLGMNGYVYIYIYMYIHTTNYSLLCNLKMPLHTGSPVETIPQNAVKIRKLHIHVVSPFHLLCQILYSLISHILYFS